MTKPAKYLIAAICVVALAVSIQAAETNDFREVNGRKYNLKPLKEWLVTDPRVRTQQRPLDGWDQVAGLRFLAKHKDGVICEASFNREQVLRGPFARLKTPQEITRSGLRLEVLIKNFPHVDQLEKKGSFPPIFAFNCGVVNTIQLNSNSLRVWVWDYGIVPKAVK